MRHHGHRNAYADRVPVPGVQVNVPILFLLAAAFGSAHATTITTATCGRNDVNTSITAAADGDTVVVSATGSPCSWVTGISTSKQITIQGTSPGAVVIVHQAGSADLLQMTTGASFHTTIANLNFLPGTGTGNYIRLDPGDGTPLVPLMHDMSFNIPNFQLEHAVEWFVTGGVIWNTTFISTDNLPGICDHPGDPGSQSGSIVVRGKKSWDEASTMGMLDVNGDQNLYIEDSVFSNVGQSPDIDDKARVVLRYSLFDGASGVTHGPTSTYAGRQVELYQNHFTRSNPNRDVPRYWWFRAGTSLITQNVVDQLSGACHGPRSSFVYVVEAAKRIQDHGCCTGYQCFHQVGTGSDGTDGHSNLSPGQTPPDPFQQSDKVYIWNNTGTGQAQIGLNQGDPANCPMAATYGTEDFFQTPRDYVVDDTSNPANGARPGWVPYPYPHPLRAGMSTLPAPTNLRSSSPNILADTITGATTCGVVLDSNPKVIVTAVSNVCAFNRSGVSSGAHIITFTAISTGDPTYGTQESVPSTPFMFTQDQTPC